MDIKVYPLSCIKIDRKNILGCGGFILLAQVLHNKQFMNSHHNWNMDPLTFIDQKIRKHRKILTPYNENITKARKNRFNNSENKFEKLNRPNSKRNCFVLYGKVKKTWSLRKHIDLNCNIVTINCCYLHFWTRVRFLPFLSRSWTKQSLSNCDFNHLNKFSKMGQQWNKF